MRLINRSILCSVSILKLCTVSINNVYRTKFSRTVCSDIIKTLFAAYCITDNFDLDVSAGYRFSSVIHIYMIQVYDTGFS